MDGRRNNGGLRSPSGGRPCWRPSRTTLLTVREHAAQGTRQVKIAKAMGVSKATLKRHCGDELQMGHLEHQANIANVAYQMAVSGNNPEMTRYWLRRYAGWQKSR